MSGFGLWFAPDFAEQGRDALRALHEPIRHRGSDGEGFLALEPGGVLHRAASWEELPRRPIQLGLCFRRREATDPSPRETQPRAGGSRRHLWIALDGAIHDAAELRAELGTHGESESDDAGLFLAAYERWGEGALERIEGVWAAAIVDLERRVLLLSTDRMGTRPIHWAHRQGLLVAGSEAKQIVGALGGRPRPNRPLIEMHLRGVRHPFVEETFFEEVQCMPPGSWTSWSLDEPPERARFRAYWKLEDHTCEPEDAPPYRDAVDRVEAELTRSLALHSRTEARLGALLSGGLDSSTLVALSAAKLDRRLPTFSFGFRAAAPESCELPWVDEVCAAWKLENAETSLEAGSVGSHLERVVRAIEEPPMAIAALAQHRVFELAAAHGIRVLLDGQGADEVFGGGLYHQRALFKQRLRQLRWLELSRELREVARRGQRPLVAVFRDLFVSPYLHRLRGRPPWIEPAPRRPEPEAFAGAAADRGRDASALNGVAYAAVRWGNSRIILGYADRSGSSHSLEVRAPYYDRRVVELAFSLPDHHKVGEGVRKRILRDVARRHLPPSIPGRSLRMGFAVPEARLLAHETSRRGIEDSLNDAGLLGSGALREDAVRRLREAWRAGRAADLRALWRIHTLACWSRVFDVRW